MAASGALGPAKVLEDRALIFERDQPASAAYFLTDGYVEIFQRVEDGRGLVVRVLGPPSVFGILETCGDETRYLESTRVLDHAILHRVERPRLHGLLHENPGAARECLATTCMAFCRVAETETARLVETEALLAASLVLYARLFGEAGAEGIRIGLRRSQADFADVVGVSERHVQRLLAAWKRSDTVQRIKGRYLVRDLDALVELSNGMAEGLLHRVATVPDWVYAPGQPA